MSAIIKLEKKHFPVLLNELVNIISPHYDGTFIDCTFGNGGYSEKILENKKNKIIAIDRDRNCIEKADFFKKKYQNRFSFFNLKFSSIEKIKLNTENLKGIIFDLGYSTIQINDLSRGLSFKSKGSLNMKMGLNKISAHSVIHKLSSENLYKIFKIFGEEKNAKLISKKLVLERDKKDIKTEDLVRIINSAKKGKKYKINNSTKVFQSIRILVNQEISELIYGLINAYKILPIGGLLNVVTFHSIEDKIVKFFFKEFSENKNNSRYLPNIENSKIIFKKINKKPIVASNQEVIENPSSRSAKLRCVMKIANTSDFTRFTNKFKNLLNLESLIENL